SFPLKASFPSDVSVEREHFYGEGNLILDTLAGAVAGTEKFEVLKSVVGLVAVNVVDSLFFKKRSPNFLLHVVAVLENFARRFPVLPGHGHTKVAVTTETRDGDAVSIF